MDDLDVDIEGDDQPFPTSTFGQLDEERPPPPLALPVTRSSSGQVDIQTPQPLQEYLEPQWLSEQTAWNGPVGSDDMDEQSRALIESMIAEEQFYFGQGSVALAPTAVAGDGSTSSNRKRSAPTTGDERPRKKPKEEPPAVSHKAKWTKEEDESLRQGITQFGFGAWKSIAAFMKTRTALQIKNHVRHLTVYSGVTFPEGNEQLEAVQEPELPSASTPTASAADLDNPAGTDGAIGEDDVDIDITDDEDGRELEAKEQPTFVLQPLSESESGEEDQLATVGEGDGKDPPFSSDEHTAAIDSSKEKQRPTSLISNEQNAETGPSPAATSPMSQPSVKSEVETLASPPPALDEVEFTSKQNDPLSIPNTPVLSTARESTTPVVPQPRQIARKRRPSLPIAKAEAVEGFTFDPEVLSAAPASASSTGQSLPGNSDACATTIDRDIIQRFEVSALPEWFLSTLALSQGKKPHPRTLNKTPDRYIKIRNYILAAWDKRRPKYLTKTSVRPGLKGEGDVNAISRIHEFLETLGAINAECAEKGGRKNYGTSVKKSVAADEDDLTEQEAGSVWNFLDARQRRKRRIRNEQGDWVDIDDDGNPIDPPPLNSEDEEATNAREEARMFALNSKYFADEELEKFDVRLLKKRQRKEQMAQTPTMQSATSDALGTYDPFRLIPARTYDAAVPAPFRVLASSNTLIVMDVHAHLAHTEIIGLLGGSYDASAATLHVTDVFPCRSQSTGVQCEMDPASEMRARDYFAAKGLGVVGWYHSHPTFDPTPSVRDIENQTAYQTLFARADGVEPFVGAIVTPYDARHAADRKSRFAWLAISQQWNSMAEYRLPYACDVSIVPSPQLGADLFDQLAALLREYRAHEHRVDLTKLYAPRHDPVFTRLDKMMYSVQAAANLVGEPEARAFIAPLRDLVLKGFATSLFLEFLGRVDLALLGHTGLRRPSNLSSFAMISALKTKLSAIASSSVPVASAPQLPPRDPVSIAPEAEHTGGVESQTSPPGQADAGESYTGPCVDVTITFASAADLPRMDLFGKADPFFRASIDGKIDYCSTCIRNTLSPTWDESWIVHRVPVSAVLSVTLFDKDLIRPTDELIGNASLPLTAGTHTIPIQNAQGREHGNFTVKVGTAPTKLQDPHPLYQFAGPVRFSTHDSPVVGALVRSDARNLYSTWKVHLMLVPVYLPTPTHWNVNYRAAQSIFAGPMSWSVRAPIMAAHRALYARQPKAHGFGALTCGNDFLRLLFGTHPIPNPRMFTYIVDDSTFRFSETGAAFLVDFASKHALHANCSEFVRYAGEFHLRPRVSDPHEADDDARDGWAHLPALKSAPVTGTTWELLIDNNSGTYAPPKEYLPALADLLRRNFPGLSVRALDREDPFLVRSREEMKAYAAANANV
ncbi:Myb-like, SWIRM and MPN domains 1 [Geranomyces variabilis]|uniref:Myb-like, SWIRM and MPN domains 1 n=1 Tax=Geranomyces variabilis TaxID=109894 RepID=A0AAD5TKU4_9FUNG|nr:Myb-like, SWIRM and MPN domains 1 [Geranomyces variabilis]